MKTKTYFILALTLACSICRGGSIEWNVIHWEYDTGYWSNLDEYILGIKTSVPISAPFNYSSGFRTKVSSSYEHASFENFRQVSWGGNGAFVQVGHGEMVDYDLYANNTADWLPRGYEDEYGWSRIDYPFDGPNNMVIPLTDEDFSNTVILAFAFYGFYMGEQVDSWWIDYYGWIEFGFGGNEVFVRNSAIERTGQGLYAGVIPEPSPSGLALAGLGLLLRRRREKKQQ